MEIEEYADQFDEYEDLKEKILEIDMKIENYDRRIESAINDAVKYDLIEEQKEWILEREKCENRLDILRQRM